MTCIRQGAQGELNTASKSQLENEFGTSKDDEVIQKILQEGTLQETEVCVPPTPLSPLQHKYTNGFPPGFRKARYHQRDDWSTWPILEHSLL